MYTKDNGIETGGGAFYPTAAGRSFIDCCKDSPSSLVMMDGYAGSAEGTSVAQISGETNALGHAAHGMFAGISGTSSLDISPGEESCSGSDMLHGW